MKESPSTAAAGAKTPERRGPYRGLGEGAGAEARRLAAAILEVLAGARTPLQAAQALGLSLPRYYLLESRAVHAIVLACEPRSPGRGVSPESALAALRRECEQLRREVARQQALVRAGQRTIGLAAPAPRGPERNGKKRRARRPTVRALRAVARLTEDQPEPAAVGTAAAGEST
jgi:hypothetical protein